MAKVTEKRKTVSCMLPGFDVDATIGGDIIDYLQKNRGKSLSEIAKILEVSKSYISRVKNRKRGLALKRLVKLERKLDLSLPLLFLEVTRTQPMPKKMKGEYKNLREIWQQSAMSSDNAS